ncbi:MAG: hypothetical protein ACYCYO_02195 [Bacilli bacterium]
MALETPPPQLQPGKSCVVGEWTDAHTERALDVMERIALRVATEVATKKREAAKAAQSANG